jgi:DNA polymerase-3 subunit alpha
VLGYYVHSHPLAEYRGILQAVCTHGSNDVSNAEPKSEVVMGGLVGALKLSNTKQPRPGSTFTRYGMFDLEDIDGLVRSICWPEEYARVGELLVPDAVVIVAGSVDRRAGSEETNLIINEIVPVADVWNRPARAVHIKVLEAAHDAETLDRLKQVLSRHEGQTPIRLVIELADGRRALLDVDGMKVRWSEGLLAELEELLGPGAVRAQVAISNGRRDDRPARGRRGGFQAAS